MQAEYTDRSPDFFDRIMALPLLRIFRPFYLRHKDVLLYIFFGGLTTLVSIGSFALADLVLGLNELIANIISWIFAVTFAYVTNRIWVFHSQATGRAIWSEAASFYGGRLLTLGIEELLLLVFVTLLHLNSMLIKIIAQFVVLISNYFISKLLVFRKKA